jgi:hypothetical protein
MLHEPQYPYLAQEQRSSTCLNYLDHDSGISSSRDSLHVLVQQGDSNYRHATVKFAPHLNRAAGDNAGP